MVKDILVQRKILSHEVEIRDFLVEYTARRWHYRLDRYGIRYKKDTVFITAPPVIKKKIIASFDEIQQELARHAISVLRLA